MKVILFLLVLSLYACNSADLPAPQLTAGPPISSANVPAMWKESDLPLTMKIADVFTNDEIVASESSSISWEDSLSGLLDFFEQPLPTTSNKNYSNLNSFQDSEMGIYKSTNWFPNISSSALAVTQYFGFRLNVGTPSEYIEINHADIIFNYRDHQFDILDDDSTLGGDLHDYVSVAVHEMGHFIGLGHQPKFWVTSVMHPSLAEGVVNREVSPTDSQDLYDLYFLDTEVSALAANALKSSAPGTDKVPVKVLWQLNDSGLCEHFVDDQWAFGHWVQL